MGNVTLALNSAKQVYNQKLTTYSNIQIYANLTAQNKTAKTSTVNIYMTFNIVNGGSYVNVGNWKTIKIMGVTKTYGTLNCSSNRVLNYLSSTYSHTATTGARASVQVTGQVNTNMGNTSMSGYYMSFPSILVAPTYSSVSHSSITRNSVVLKATVDIAGYTFTQGGWDVGTSTSSYTYHDGGYTNATITGLNPGTTYYYRGWTKTAGGGTNSAWYNFTTLANTKPTVAVTTPLTVTPTSVLLKWTETVQSGYTISKRTFQYRKSFESTFTTVDVTSASGSTGTTISNLESGVEYYYSMTVTDSGGLVSTASTGYFTTLSNNKMAYNGTKDLHMSVGGSKVKGIAYQGNLLFKEN